MSKREMPFRFHSKRYKRKRAATEVRDLNIVDGEVSSDSDSSLEHSSERGASYHGSDVEHVGEGFHDPSEEEDQNMADEGHAEGQHTLPLFFEDVDAHEVNSGSDSEFSDEDDVVIDNILRANDSDGDMNDESSVESSDDDRNVERGPVFKIFI